MYKVVFFGAFLYLVLCVSCAQIGSPTGGSIDSIPPIHKKSIPENMSTNFSDDRIELEFNEYVQLKSLQNELIVSPPLNETPDIYVQYKKVVIKIQDTALKDSTTYNFNFGNAIADLNEGNSIENFQYIFSTGSQIDSLRISGRVLNAFDLSKPEDVYVGVYSDFDDSIPALQKPDYISKVDTGGYFTLYSLKEGTYKILALIDGNRNLLFDQPTEEVAFLDSFLMPTVKLSEQIDTIKIKEIDTLENDSIIESVSDSIDRKIVSDFSPDNIELFLFKADVAPQYLKSKERPIKEKCTFVFNRKLERQWQIVPLDIDFDNEDFFFEYPQSKDSVICWIADSTIYNSDSVRFMVTYMQKDSTQQYVEIKDTIRFKFKFPKKDKEKQKPENEEDTIKTQKVVEVMKVTANVKGSLELFQDLTLTVERPLIKFDSSKIKLFILEDTILKTEVDTFVLKTIQRDTNMVDTVRKDTTITLETPKTLEHLQPFLIKPDSLNPRKFIIDFDRKEKTTYKLFVDTATFEDIFYLSQDTVEFTFTTKAPKDYGNLFLTIQAPEYPIMVQLLVNDKISQEYYAEDASPLTIKNLVPGNYKLKAYSDANKNKKWDTGDYWKHKQPEKVFFFAPKIVIKAGFDMETQWEIP